MLVSKVRTRLQPHEYIGATCVEDTHLGVCCTYLLSDEQGYREGDILLLTAIAHGTGVLPSVASIDDDRKEALRVHPDGRKRKESE